LILLIIGPLNYDNKEPGGGGAVVVVIYSVGAYCSFTDERLRRPFEVTMAAEISLYAEIVVAVILSILYHLFSIVYHLIIG